jgi:hypothetical protein
MQPFSTQNLLAAWELGWAQPHVIQRSLTLLSAAHPDVPPAAFADLTIGERDTLLLDLREQIFGSRMNALAVCPGCGQRLEFQFDTSDVRVGQEVSAKGEISACVGDYRITFRLPNSHDVTALAEVADVETGRHRLLERVVLRALHRDLEIPAAQVPEHAIAVVEEEMAKADPQSEVQLSLSCESCGKRWQSPFDIVHFLWSELDACAVRLLREVHSLARAYGWQEADILSMTAWRRHCYLEMLSE